MLGRAAHLDIYSPNRTMRDPVTDDPSVLPQGMPLVSALLISAEVGWVLLGIQPTMLPLAQLSTVDLKTNGWEANNDRKTPQPQVLEEATNLKKVTIVGARKVTGKQEDVDQLRRVDEAAGKAKIVAVEVRDC